MIIKKVDNIIDAIECNKLLNKLIENESKYDKNIKSNYIINEYFEEIHNNKNNCLFIAKDNDNLAIGYIFCKIIINYYLCARICKKCKRLWDIYCG